MAATAAIFETKLGCLALPRLETRILLVDYIDAAAAANDTVRAMTTLKGLQRISDLHGTISVQFRGYGSLFSWPFQ